MLANQIYLFYVNKGVNNSIIQYKMNSGKNILTSFAAVVALSLLLLIGPTSMSMTAFAQGNSANQGIGQSQSSTQLGVCVSGTGTLISCNNLNSQNQANSGNNALAQQGGSGKGGNTANQAIGQAQSSAQNASRSAGVGGKPVRSSDTRRRSVSLLAAGEGASPSVSSRARMKRSMGFLDQAASFT